jgi:hypothetical protein
MRGSRNVKRIREARSRVIGLAHLSRRRSPAQPEER